MSDELTGGIVAQRRKDATLSRERFATLAGISPGALWRIEVKNNWKPGEREKVAQFLESLPDYPSLAVPGPPQTSSKSVTIVDAETPTDDTSTLLGVTAPPVDFTEVNTQLTYEIKPLPILAHAEESPTVMSQRDGKWRVSNSEVQTWKRCRRKWWFTYYRMLSPIFESPVGARAVGTRIHDALRYAYLADPSQRMDPRDALETLINNDQVELVKQLNEPGRFESTEDLIKQFQKEADLERVMIAGYVEWLQETGADSEFEITGSEVYLEAELPEVPHALIIARLDARVRRIMDGVRLFIDHKTVGDFTQPARTLHMDEQMLWYLLIERLQSDDTPVAGALYNMLKKSKRSQKATPPFFKRIEVHHNKHSIENFRLRLKGTLYDIMGTRKALDEGAEHRVVTYPTPRRDCAWDCPFFQVCGMMDDGSYAEGMLNQFYKTGDPLGYYTRGVTPQSPDLT